MIRPLPEFLQQKITRYQRWEKAQSCLLGYRLLLEGLQRLDLESTALIRQLQLTEYGRPYLPGTVDFNIAHSADHIVCAMSTDCRVGIDIEILRPVTIAHFKYQLTAAEWDAITISSEPVSDLFHLWTKKEAVLKAHGYGLHRRLSHVHIENNAAMIDGTTWRIHQVKTPHPAVCHLATDQRLPASEIHCEEVKFQAKGS